MGFILWGHFDNSTNLANRAHDKQNSANINGGRSGSVKPADPKYYTTEKQADGRILVIIHGTVLGDIKSTIDVRGAKNSIGSGSAAGFPIEIVCQGGRITSVKWDGRFLTVRPGNDNR